MNQLRYLVLIVLVVIAAGSAVLWQSRESDQPVITFTRPQLDDTSGAKASSDDATTNETNAIVPLTEPLTPPLDSDTPELTVPPVATIDQPIDDEALAEQIRQAQEKLAQVEALNERKQALVEQELAQESDASQSLLEAELAYRIGEWRQAWRTGDIERYFAHYSENFSPNNGSSVDEWKAKRVKRLNPNKPITLELEDFKVQFDEQTQRSLVKFKQLYRSGDYQDQVRKRLVLVKEQGQWKIVSEIVE